jgi:autotransporter-associated beta strand protein
VFVIQVLSLSLLLAVPVNLAVAESAGRGDTRPALPNFDKRLAIPGRPFSVTDSQQVAVVRLQQRVPDVQVDFDDVLGSPEFVRPRTGFLTGRDGEGGGVAAQTARAFAANDPHRALKGFLTEHATLFGHGAEALAKARIEREYVTPHNGMQTVIWEQQVDGIAVYQARLIAHTTRKGELVNISSHFIPDTDTAATRGTPDRATLVAAPVVSAPKAVALAAQNIGTELTANQVTVLAAAEAGPEKHQKFKAPGLIGESDARLTWLPTDRNTLRLCWDVVLMSRQRGEMFRLVLDARTGEVLVRTCLTHDLSDATYRVFTSDSPSPFSPGWSSPNTNQPPLVSRTLVTLSALDTNASPAGWINDGDNQTLGNNVDAHTDRNADNSPDLPRPQGVPFRVFDFPMDLTTQDPTNYASASVVQLFYLCNRYHDLLYQLGFTEAAGNFQTTNFGRGGVGNDAVLADAQDGNGLNNANFSTPPDGSPGRMQMYIYNKMSPRRDGGLDTEIVFHELTHGLSWRVVGGGQKLGTTQSDGLGEGWSDFYPLSLLSETGDDVNGVYAAGAYVSYKIGGSSDTHNYYFGIRRYPYSTDMSKNPLTFKDIDPAQADYCSSGAPFNTHQFGSCSTGSASEVHNVGEVWCVTLWDARANLINKYGWAVGNQLILQLVTDGMKLTPSKPNFLQARDAILQADLVDTGGLNRRDLWLAFAKRGMGYSATSPASTTATGVHEAYDLPPTLLTLTLPASATEGDGVLAGQGQVSIGVAPTSALVLNLASSNTGKLTVPATVTILANQTNATFNITVIDNALLDGTQTAAITASASNVISATANMTIFDNETASLGVIVPPSATEGDGVLTNAGQVTVSAPVATNVVVTLTSSDTTEVTVPPSVTVPAGQTSAVFNVTIVADNVIDGMQTATITAHVQNWIDGSAMITVYDNTNLTVTLPALAYEGDGVLTNAGRVTISGTRGADLPVTLFCDNVNKVVVPPSVTISAGQTSAVFSVTIVDNLLHDGIQSATVTASASGFAPGSAIIAVHDNEFDHFTMSAIASPQSAGTPFPLTLTAADVNGAAIAVYTNTLTLTGAGDNGPVTVLPTNLTGFTNGIWSGNVRVNSRDTNIRLIASDGAGHSVTSIPFTVQIGPVDHFVWDTVPTPQNLDVAFPVRVVAQDAANNIVSNFTGTVALTAFSTNAGPSQLLTFDDVSTGSVPANYGNLNWNNFRVVNGQSYGSGYQVGMVSSPNVAFNSLGNPASLTSTAAFNLVSAYLTSAYLSSQTVSFKGYADGTLVYDTSYTINNTAPTFVTFNYLGVTEIDITASGSQMVLDNLVTANPTMPVSISPTNSGNFVNGVWTGAVTVLQATNGIRLVACDPGGHSGTSTFFTVVSAVDLGVTMLDTPDPVTSGSNLTYSITITNTGPNRAPQVVLTDPLPSNGSFVSATVSQGTWTQSTGVVTCSLGSISNNASATATIIVTPYAVGRLTNTVTVTSADNDLNPSNNTATVITMVNPGALDHFAWSLIASPQHPNEPFPVTITAQDANTNTVTTFSGAVTISGETLVADNVENGANGWSHSGPQDQWHISTNRFRSAGHSWYCGTETSRTYTNDMNCSLVSTSMLLGTGAKISFQHYCNKVEGFDYAYVEISTNNGATYTTLVSLAQTAFAWQGSTNDLSAYAGQQAQIRFRFTSSPYSAGICEGWYVDDITISPIGQSAIPTTPTTTGNFTNGLWTGTVSVLQPATNLAFRATETGGHNGISSFFNVIPRTPILAVSPASYNFGYVVTGGIAQTTFIITNSGDGALTGTASVGTPFAIVAGSPYTVAPAGSTNVIVSFTPSAVGTYSNNVIFTSNGGSSTNSVTGVCSADVPVASFTGSPTNGVAPLAVTFTDTSIGNITNRVWSFGDGGATNTTATTVPHTYQLPSTNTVRLIVSGPFGTSTNTQPNYITVTAPPTATWTNPAASGNWSNLANWDTGSVPDNGASVIFGTGGSTCVVDSVSRSVGNVLFNRAANFVVTNSGGAGLTVLSGITVSNTFNHKLGAPVLLGGTNSWFIANGGTLQASGIISGVNPLTKSGAGTLILTGSNTYTGPTTVLDGTLSQAANPTNTITVNTGAVYQATTGGGAGKFAGSGKVILAGIGNSVDARLMATTGIVAIQVNGDWLNSNNGTNWQSTVMTLEVPAGYNFDMGSNDLLQGAGLTGAGGLSPRWGSSGNTSLRFVGSGNYIFGGTIGYSPYAGGMHLIQNGTGTQTLAGNVYADNITIGSNATLQFGTNNAAALQMDAGYAITNNGTLIFNWSQTNTVACVITGSGTLIKTGAGKLTLSAANLYTGPTIVSNGTLLVTGSLTTTTVTVASTGTLGGTGTLNGSVTIAGTLSPGTSVGTLTISNSLTLASTATLLYDLGASNDLVAITGNLTLAGTLNVTNSGGFGLGSYTLFTYAGSLINNGLTIGTVPNPAYGYLLDTNTARQVNLLVVASPFVAWQLSKFGFTNDIAVPTANPTGDGLANLMKYALGLDPLTACVNPLQFDRATTNGFTYLRLSTPRDPSATNVLIEGLSTGTLLDTNAWSATTTVIESNTPSFFRVRDALPIETNTHRFLKLRFTLP